eukprot:2034820-Pleurochrysis_carterae.AAC.4
MEKAATTRRGVRTQSLGQRHKRVLLRASATLAVVSTIFSFCCVSFYYEPARRSMEKMTTRLRKPLSRSGSSLLALGEEDGNANFASVEAIESISSVEDELTSAETATGATILGTPCDHNHTVLDAHQNETGSPRRFSHSMTGMFASRMLEAGNKVMGRMRGEMMARPALEGRASSKANGTGPVLLPNGSYKKVVPPAAKTTAEASASQRKGTVQFINTSLPADHYLRAINKMLGESGDGFFKSTATHNRSWYVFAGRNRTGRSVASISTSMMTPGQSIRFVSAAPPSMKRPASTRSSLPEDVIEALEKADRLYHYKPRSTQLALAFTEAVRNYTAVPLAASALENSVSWMKVTKKTKTKPGLG